MFTVTLKTTGSQTVTATDKSNGVIQSNTSSSVTVNPGALNDFVFSNIGTQTAGTPFNITITAQDAYGNTVTGFTSTAVLTSDNTAGAIDPAITTSNFVSGVRTNQSVTWTFADTADHLFATASGKTGTSNSFVLNPAAKNKIVITTQPASASPQVGVDLTTDPAIAIEDTYNNVLTTDNSDTVSISTVLSTQACGGTAGSGTLTANPTSGSRVGGGVITYSSFVYTAVQSVKFCFSTSGLTATQSNTVVYSPGPLDHFGFATIAAQVAGTPFNVTMTAQDFYNNTIPTYTNKVTLSSTNAGSISPTTSANFVAGVLTQSITLTIADTNEAVTAEDSGGTKTGTSNSFVVTYVPTTTAALYPTGTGNFGDLVANTGTTTAAVGSADADDTTYLDDSTVTRTSTFKVANAALPFWRDHQRRHLERRRAWRGHAPRCRWSKSPAPRKCCLIPPSTT